MNSTFRTTSALALWAIATVAVGQTVSVGTDSSVSASYGGVTQTAGPFPWSDLGISATASVSPGDLNVATGGSTAFTLTNPLSAGQQVGAGTVLNVAYTPGWTGSFSQASVTGNVNSSFVYSIGPLSGSSNLINVPVSSSSSPSADLAASLNAPAGPAVSSSVSGMGPGATAGYTLQARGCAFVCVTLASASLGVTIGTQVQQSVSVSPTVTYGDLVWISTTPTSHYTASDPQAFIAGTGGNIANSFGGIGSLGLAKGQTFYYNMMPEVELDMSVTSQAQLNLPASITASYNVFGVGGSRSFPLGNLYTLSTGAEGFDVSTTFHNNDYYSVKMDYEGAIGLAGPSAVAVVAGDYTGQLVPLGGDTLPPDTGPCAGMPVGCKLSLPGGPGTMTGYGTQNMGSLIPGDQGPAGACAPAGTSYAGSCINQVTTNGGPVSAPEIDAASSASALTFLLGTLTVMRGRRRTPATRGA
jgi:hypothetical protein